MPAAEKTNLMCPSGSLAPSGEPANTERSFTPGPWQTGVGGRGFFHSNRVWTADNRPIVNMLSMGMQPADICPEAQANARLIAAAPTMFEALREIEFIFDGQEDIDDNGGPNDAMKALTAVRDALAKAVS